MITFTPVSDLAEHSLVETVNPIGAGGTIYPPFFQKAIFPGKKGSGGPKFDPIT